jgi:hypothetical protein
MKRFRPHLHLSTVLTLFLIASVFLGLQFIAHKYHAPKSIVKGDFMIYGTPLMDYHDYGFPFTVYSNRPPKWYNPTGEQWDRTAIALNSLTALAILITVAVLSETIIGRRAHRQLELEKK